MVIVVVVAVTAGYLAGGRLHRLAELRFRGSWLLLLAVAFVPSGFGRGGRAGTVATNGAMPTPVRVLAGPEWWPNLWLTPHLAEHAPIDSTTRLVWLADSIELRLPHILVPVSPGDLLLFAGVIALVVTAMRRRVAAEAAGPRAVKRPVASRQEGPGP
jgi:Family of unknown function (DUF5317)